MFHHPPYPRAPVCRRRESRFFYIARGNQKYRKNEVGIDSSAIRSSVRRVEVPEADRRETTVVSFVAAGGRQARRRRGRGRRGRARCATTSSGTLRRGGSGTSSVRPPSSSSPRWSLVRDVILLEFPCSRTKHSTCSHERHFDLNDRKRYRRLVILFIVVEIGLQL